MASPYKSFFTYGYAYANLTLYDANLIRLEETFEEIFPTVWFRIYVTVILPKGNSLLHVLSKTLTV